jgi:hypothetical protein
MARRATKRTPEIIEEIIDGVANGVPLREVCRRDGMPNWRTVYDWLEADEEFAARFARARDIGFDAIAEDILQNVDSVPAQGEYIQRSKLQVETRLKLLAKWSPKKYGDKQTVDVGNKEGETLKVDSNVDKVALTLALAKAIRGEEVELPPIDDAKDIL